MSPTPKAAFKECRGIDKIGRPGIAVRSGRANQNLVQWPERAGVGILDRRHGVAQPRACFGAEDANGPVRGVDELRRVDDTIGDRGVEQGAPAEHIQRAFIAVFAGRADQELRKRDRVREWGCDDRDLVANDRAAEIVPRHPVDPDIAIEDIKLSIGQDDPAIAIAIEVSQRVAADHIHTPCVSGFIHRADDDLVGLSIRIEVGQLASEIGGPAEGAVDLVSDGRGSQK
jgi:hypothetical protein